MNRRNFFRNIMLATVGAAWSFGAPNLITNAVLYSPHELKREELFSTDLNHLEKIIMAGGLITEENFGSLILLQKEISKKLDFNDWSEKIKDEIAEFVIERAKRFSKRTASDTELYETINEIDRRYQKIIEAKQREKIEFISYVKKLFVSLKDDLLEQDGNLLNEFYCLDNRFSLIKNFIENNKSPSIKRLYEALINLSSDFLFIKEASEISGISIEEIVALSNIESLGREFAIGREGELNRFQFHPKYLNYIYDSAISQKNLLSEYILKKTTKNTLLENLSRDSRLNIALAVNYMKNLKKNTRTYYEYILAYNLGLGRVRNLPKKIKRKLEKPEDILEKEKKYFVFKYYIDFLNSKMAFEKLREFASGIINLKPKS